MHHKLLYTIQESGALNYSTKILNCIRETMTLR